MGLAASQARFLGLTARKSNVEYEGQQVNQQRTALANESASLYSQLTNLKVPTPPDVTNYYRTEYSFKYNDVTYTFETLPVRNSDGTYMGQLGYTSSVSGFNELTSLEGINLSNPTLAKLSDYKDFHEYLNKNIGTEQDGNTQIKTYSSDDKKFYLQVGSGDNTKTYQHFQNNVNESKIYTNAVIRYNQSGDYESIKIPEFSENELPVSSTTTQDTDAYNLAMSEYQKEYNQYEKTMAAINAKTETIQQQDKTLELRLNQLDTEQNAIATEMDAVTKVIEKNVQSTFKTFA